MNNSLVVGVIKGAKVVTRKNKTTQVESSDCEVIIQYEDYDKNGELVLDTDSISFPLADLSIFKESLNKFITVPYMFLSTPKGSWFFKNDDMKYTIYEKNPFQNFKSVVKS